MVLSPSSSGKLHGMGLAHGEASHLHSGYSVSTMEELSKPLDLSGFFTSVSGQMNIEYTSFSQVPRLCCHRIYLMHYSQGWWCE